MNDARVKFDNTLDECLDSSEYVVHITTESDPYDGYWVAVSKVGGGLKGRSYPGRWFVTIMDGEGRRMNRYNCGGEFASYIELTHDQVAHRAIDSWERNNG